MNHQVGYQIQNMKREHNDTKNTEVEEFSFFKILICPTNLQVRSVLVIKDTVSKLESA